MDHIPSQPVGGMPFDGVIVGGLIADLVMNIFLLPTLYVWIAGEHDVLPDPESEWMTD